MELGNESDRFLSIGKIVKLVHFVEHRHHWDVIGFYVFQSLLNRFPLRQGIGMGDINHMQISRSASDISSRVARKAATNWVGSFWMKPTVSVSKARLPPGRFIRRVVGSRVANN